MCRKYSRVPFLKWKFICPLRVSVVVHCLPARRVLTLVCHAAMDDDRTIIDAYEEENPACDRIRQVAMALVQQITTHHPHFADLKHAGGQIVCDFVSRHPDASHASSGVKTYSLRLPRDPGQSINDTALDVAEYLQYLLHPASGQQTTEGQYFFYWLSRAFGERKQLEFQLLGDWLYPYPSPDDARRVSLQSWPAVHWAEPPLSQVAVAHCARLGISNHVNTESWVSHRARLASLLREEHAAETRAAAQRMLMHK